MSAKTFEHDYNGNVTEVKEYDWFAPIPASGRDPAGVPLGVPGGLTPLRTTTTAYHNSPAADTSGEVYAKRALPAAGSYVLNAAMEAITGPSVTRFSYDGQGHGAAPTKGNVTKVESLDDRGDTNTANDQWVTTKRTYDPTYGNLETSTDANGNVTRFYYEDATHALPTRVEVDPLNGTGVQATHAAYDYWTGLVTSTTDPNNQTTTLDYTNQLLGAVDPFGRPGVVRAPAGTAPGGATLYRKSYIFYEDAARRVRTESDLNAEDDRLLKSRTTSDQLGRGVLAEQSEDGSTYTISAQTVYAAGGRVTLRSSPARAGSPAEGWTRVTKDIRGRVVEAATFGGAAQPSATAQAHTIANWTGSVTTSYSANVTTITDQADRKRRSVSDALGRLVRVDEPEKDSGALDAGGGPVQPTSYTYDALGNLRRVEQGGQLRFFMYDSLGRLIRARNPEQAAGSIASNITDPLTLNNQWSMAYGYDANGNLTARVDARDVTTTYAYDGLNRNTLVHYDDAVLGLSNHTPDVERHYDGAPNGRGRLWWYQAVGVAATGVDSYDAAGRPTQYHQVYRVNNNWGEYYNVSAAYDLAGNLKSQSYPSGHSVSYTYDDAGRLIGFTGNLGEGGAARTYADSFAYDAAGRRRQERFGTTTPLYHKRHYNSRGQLFDVRLSTQSLQAGEWDWDRGAIINYYGGNYAWEGDPNAPASADNNGNLRRQQHFAPAGGQGAGFTFTQQTYGYDPLNRLAWVEEAAGADSYAAGPAHLRQSFDYDRWGNRTVDADGTWLGQPGAAPSQSVNEKQFDKSDLQHTNRLHAPGDAALPLGQRLMRYDAAGNLVHDWYTGGGGRAYDAENRMTAAADVNGGTTSYGYDADGRRVKRLAGSAGEVWQVYGVGGELLAEYAKGALPTQPRKEYGYRGGELLVTAEAASAGWGPAPAFQDDPLVAGQTVVRSLHVTELRSAINALRAHRGLGQYVWQAAAAQGAPVKADPIVEMRAALDEALGTPQGGYAAGLAQGQMIRAIHIQELRGRVLGALQAGGGGADIRWLVTDQLGTPRMVVDRTGTLAGVTRHDYLPFGEEIGANIGGRAALPGYSQTDGLRQRFTSKERDQEVTLDYFGARYYSATAGRFTTVDPLNPLDDIGADGGHLDKYLCQPQHWNKYAYALNNPHKYVDPDGKHPAVAIAIGAGVGALLGGGWELAKQYYHIHQNGGEGKIDWSKVAGKAAEGAIIGAVAGATGGASLAASALYMSAASIAGGVTNRAIDGDETTNPLAMNDMLTDGLAGAAGGAIGSKIEGQMWQRLGTSGYFKGAIKNAERELRRVARRSASRRAAAEAQLYWLYTLATQIATKAAAAGRGAVKIGVTVTIREITEEEWRKYEEEDRKRNDHK